MGGDLSTLEDVVDEDEPGSRRPVTLLLQDSWRRCGEPRTTRVVRHGIGHSRASVAFELPAHLATGEIAGSLIVR